MDRDRIVLRNLSVHGTIGEDHWHRLRKQPLSLTLELEADVSTCAATDDIQYTVDYSPMSRKAIEFAESAQFKSLEDFAEALSAICLQEPRVTKVKVQIEKLRALLHGECVGLIIHRSKSHIKSQQENDRFYVRNLCLNTIIGINECERLEKQKVVINLGIDLETSSSTVQSERSPFAYLKLVNTLSARVEESSYGTVESLVYDLAQLAIDSCELPNITVRLEKPHAVVMASGAGVEITRQAKDRYFLSKSPKGLNVAFLGMGTNLGDNLVKNFDDALLMLECNGVKVVDTSFLYETPPMYVENQPMFLNAVCKVETSLDPHELLKTVKSIEKELGRDFTAARNHARVIDLDILFYNSLVMKTDDLVIPHPSMNEREFVLRPLCDDNSIESQLYHPTLHVTSKILLERLLEQTHPDEGTDAYKVIPIHGQTWRWDHKTFVMGVLNTTPDSFSDGGKFNTLDTALGHASTMMNEGADVVDIGGMSSRPGSDEIPLSDELDRTIPFIRKIRENLPKLWISIDTYRSQVAERAVEAGANLVNDISGGELDPTMYATMAKLNVPVILMHMRGTPKTMSQLTDYSNNDVVGDIIKSLHERVAKAIANGVRRWNIILDPGIGFAKTGSQNFDIIKKLGRINGSSSPLRGFPLLSGPSRKGFIGKATGKEVPKDRVFGTAAAVTASVLNGCNIVRIHDVAQMVDVVKVADQCKE